MRSTVNERSPGSENNVRRRYIYLDNRERERERERERRIDKIVCERVCVRERKRERKSNMRSAECDDVRTTNYQTYPTTP